MSEILNTPFTHKHLALGAKMAPFAGYNMPISYTGINDEHAAVRNSAGVFDVSHMGEFVLKGENALDLIQRVTSNDASVLEDGKAQYSCLPNTTGGIVDDLLVYCVEKNKVYMLVVNASNIEKDWNWISSYNTKGVEMHNISAKTALLAVQGPNATQIVQTMTKMDVLNLPYYSFVKGDLLGIDNVLISATGYTGSGGVEIYFEEESNSDINFRVNSDGVRITTSAQVESSEDLEVFKTNMTQKEPSVSEIETKSDESTVTVVHKHDGKLFGIFPVTITSVTTVEAKDDGKTEVHARKSWYSFLVANESYSRSDVESKILNNPTVQANASSNLSAQAKAVIAEIIINEVAAQTNSSVSV